MSGVAAHPVAATLPHTQPRRNRAGSKFPGNAVGEGWVAVSPSSREAQIRHGRVAAFWTRVVQALALVDGIWRVVQDVPVTDGVSVFRKADDVHGCPADALSGHAEQKLRLELVSLG